jgi:hypothetical protein
MNRLIIISLSIILLLSCKKDDEAYSDIPAIEFVSLTPSSASEFSKDIKLIISYKDGDGDIGTEDPDEYTLLIHDSRLPATDEYHIQPLTPPNSKIQIEGELKINLAGLFVLGTDSTESTTFSIKLKDRAGNWSNEVTTSSITVNK